MLQKSEGGALGMGGGGMSGFMTGRSTANLLTRTTAILAAAFFATSILLVVLSNYDRAPRSIIDEGGPPPAAPVGAGAGDPSRAGAAEPGCPGPAGAARRAKRRRSPSELASAIAGQVAASNSHGKCRGGLRPSTAACGPGRCPRLQIVPAKCAVPRSQFAMGRVGRLLYTEGP